MLYGTNDVLDLILYVVLDLMRDVTHDVLDLILVSYMSVGPYTRCQTC